MIVTDAQLEQAYEALGDLYRALASYRATILPANPRNYLLLARGPLEEVRKIQSDIDEYLQLKQVEVELGHADTLTH